LDYNLKDNVNAYELQEDGSYVKVEPSSAEELPFDMHQRFFEDKDDFEHINLFPKSIEIPSIVPSDEPEINE